MPNYRARIDRLEGQIALEERVIVLVVRDGQTQGDLLATCAKARRVKPSEIRVPVVYLSEADALL
jgi:hypothetical protein